MLKITRCGQRFLLSSNLRDLDMVAQAIHIHLSRKEMASILRTGKKAFAAKRQARACSYCDLGGAD